MSSVKLPTPKVPFHVTDTVRRFCGLVSEKREPCYVEVRPEAWALPRECFPNVARKVAESGGRIQYGWAIWQCSQFFIEAEHHAIYDAQNGEPLIDITPQVPMVPKILFLPDDSATYDFGTTNQKDNHRMALLNDSRVRRILELFTARTTLFNSIPSVGGKVTFSGERLRALMTIQNEIQILSSNLMQGQAINIWKI